MENHLERLQAIWGPEPGQPTRALNWILGTVDNKTEEGLYIDFKQKSDRREPSLNDDDRANLAKAISGFGNTDGGLIVWGVKAKADTKDDPDVAIELSPINKLKTFQTQLNHACGEVVIPPVAGVESRAVPETPSADSGYVITIVPKRRDALIQANAKKCKGFYIRSGSGFHQLPEPLIAEFYRTRPSAILRLTVDLAEPEEARTDEELLEAEQRDSLNRPYGTCTYRQSAAIAWSAGVRNDGAGSATEVVVDLRVSLPCRWSVTDYRVRKHEYHAGMSVIPVFEPIPDISFKDVAGDRGFGKLLEPLHPGQAVVVARGELLIPLDSLRRAIPDFEVVGRAFAKDTPSYPLSWRVKGSDLGSRYAAQFERMAAEALPPCRVIAKPVGRKIRFDDDKG